MTSKRWQARVLVFPRPEILDPQGKAVTQALGRLGFDEVMELRAGKAFELELEAPGREEAEGRLVEMCEQLLANTIIEDYRVEVSERPLEEAAEAVQ